jgi:hypothetical protein
MNYEHIETLAQQYTNALHIANAAVVALAQNEAALVRLRGQILADAYRTGAISGKNAEIRKAQEMSILLDNEDYFERVKEVEDQRASTSKLEADCKAVDVSISLIRAWLYSQCKIG